MLWKDAQDVGTSLEFEIKNNKTMLTNLLIKTNTQGHGNKQPPADCEV